MVAECHLEVQMQSRKTRIGRRCLQKDLERQEVAEHGLR